MTKAERIIRYLRGYNLFDQWDGLDEDLKERIFSDIQDIIDAEEFEALTSEYHYNGLGSEHDTTVIRAGKEVLFVYSDMATDYNLSVADHELERVKRILKRDDLPNIKYINQLIHWLETHYKIYRVSSQR